MSSVTSKPMASEVKRKTKKAHKRVGFYTSPEIQTRVRLKRAQGYSKRQIALSERLNPTTVTKILNQAQAQKALKQAALDMLGNINIPLRAIIKAIQKGDTALAKYYLEACGLIRTHHEQGEYADGSAQHVALNPRVLDITPTSREPVKRQSPFMLKALEHYEKMTEEFDLPEVPEESEVASE